MGKSGVTMATVAPLQEGNSPRVSAGQTCESSALTHKQTVSALSKGKYVNVSLFRRSLQDLNDGMVLLVMFLSCSDVPHVISYHRKIRDSACYTSLHT